MDPESPWEENPVEDHIPEVEWTKITSEFTNSGYRDGIISGKEAFLQQGFDAGFADVGAPLGRELGNLRGVAAAIWSFLISQTPESPELEEIRTIYSLLSAIQLSDIAPRDLEAERHANLKERLDDPAVAQTADFRSEKGTVPQEESCSVEQIPELKGRLALLTAKLGLPVLGLA